MTTASNKATKRSAPEAALGPPVIAWLESQGWNVYQEVESGRQSYRADIVATKDKLVLVVELKTSLTFELLYQAQRWRDKAHHVYAAVPACRPSDGRRMAMSVFEERGIGVLVVTTDSRGHIADRVKVQAQAPFFRQADAERLRQRIKPEHKHAAVAGSKGGGYSTDFTRTLERIKYVARSNPGITLRKAIEEVDHHYASVASARAQIVKLMRSGVIKGLRIERRGREQVLVAETP